MSNKDHDATAKAQVDAIGIPDGEPNFLPQPLLDRLLEATISLGGELWVERERRMTLESLLVSKGLVSEGEIELYTPTDDDLTRRQQAREEIVKRIFGPLTTLQDPD